YVADQGNHRIQKFDGNGTFICSWGNRGVTEGQLNFPSGVAVDKTGNVYVVDSGNNRVLKYAPTEEEINRASQSAQPQETGGMVAPRNLVAKPGDTEVILSWLEMPGVQSYNLYFH